MPLYAVLDLELDTICGDRHGQTTWHPASLWRRTASRVGPSENATEEYLAKAQLFGRAVLRVLSAGWRNKARPKCEGVDWDGGAHLFRSRRVAGGLPWMSQFGATESRVSGPGSPMGGPWPLTGGIPPGVPSCRSREPLRPECEGERHEDRRRRRSRWRGIRCRESSPSGRVGRDRGARAGRVRVVCELRSAVPHRWCHRRSKSPPAADSREPSRIARHRRAHRPGRG